MTTTEKGHPKGLYLLFATEMWERFSYYGMRGLLTLYLTKATIEGGLGFDDANAGLIYGIYTGLVYLTPIFGGWLADNILGQRKSITLGGILMALGQICLFMSSSEQIVMFYAGLILLIIGNGFFKPNISTVVGQLYPPGDNRKDSAFTIFYMGINLGAFLAPLVCGYLAEDIFAVKDAAGKITAYGFNYGFLAAGIGMIIGQILFNSLGQTYLGDLGKEPGAKLQKANAAAQTPLTQEEKQRMNVIVIMMLFNIFFWAGFEQAGSSISLYTDRFIDRTIGDWTIPTSWFQSVNPLFIVLLGPLFTMLWTFTSRKNKEPNSIVKMGLGMILLGLGFFLMIGAALQRGGDIADQAVKANVMWLVGTYLIHTMGELCLSPVGLSLVTKLAPLRLGSLMMGVWFLSSFIANFLSGYLVQFFASMGAMTIFAIISTVVIVLGGIVLFLSNRLLKLMHGVR
ncbi:MAG: MFS transporter [Bacteroidia bacterium]|jgi:POT family proton-dependent oligopeptide transporter|nr:MFS transporter [Bacteroidia bacterium]NBX19356.1 MFS transporter [Bacteroidia bacterium]NBY10371.1 MFS transporter [Sphingobacteriia bacterium]